MDVTILSPYYLDQHRNVADFGFPAAANREVGISLPADTAIQTRVGAICQAIAHDVADVLAAGDRPVCLAGDCCAAIGIMAGLQREGLHPTLIWFDAHGDFNTWQTTPSGFLGGMPLAMMVGRGEQTLLEAAGMEPLSEEAVILTDARDLDPEERDLVNASAIRHLSRVEALLESGSMPDGPLYVHFDSDIVNPTEAPAMNYPAAGGPSSDELARVFLAIAETSRVAAVSVSLWEPRLDPDGRTRRVTLGLVQTLLGQ